MHAAKQALPAFFIVLVATLLSFLLFLYLGQQQALLLEGNSLHSANATQATNASFGELTEMLPSLGANARVLAAYDEQYGVLVVAANDYESLPFPLYEGDGFSNNAEKQALVGSAVADADAASITVDGEEYAIVGRLGTRPSSPLQQFIVLNACPALGEGSLGRPVIDGMFAPQILASQQPDITLETLNEGAEGRTSLDTASPLLVGSGVAAGMLALCCAGLCHMQLRRDELAILHVQGVSRRRLATRTALQLSVIALLAVTLVGGGFALAGQRLSPGHIAVTFTLAALLPIGTALACEALRRRRLR